MTVEIPHNFVPRDYQLPLFQAYDSGLYDRFVLMEHRRAGKDISCFNLNIKALAKEPMIATYAFPTLKMGREILWEGMDNEGNKFIEHYIPPQLLDGPPNNTRMTLNFKNGSIFRIGGSDNPDSLRGGNTKLFTLSEWSEHDPYTWSVIRPIVLANKGKVIFNYTPKGENHGKTTYEQGLLRDRTYVQKLTAIESGVFSLEQLEEELRELKQENGETEGQRIFDQEYMVSFDAPVIGSYYAEKLKLLEKDGRLTSVPYESIVLVDTYWDLGMDDSMTIWFVQQVGNEVRLIDYYENSGEGLEHYAGVLSSKGYSYGKHYAPHDIEVRELGTGKSRKEVAKSLGINFSVAPKLGILEGVQAVRSLLSRCWFDKVKTERGYKALKAYAKKWDAKNKTYMNVPNHNWASHGSDAFRTLAVSIKPIEPKVKAPSWVQNQPQWHG